MLITQLPREHLSTQRQVTQSLTGPHHIYMICINQSDMKVDAPTL